MGAWGTGILQNDGAQDGLVGAAQEVEQAIRGIADDVSDDGWQELLAGVGLLIQFSPYSLKEENPFSEDLARAIATHRPQMIGVRGDLDDALEDLAHRREPQYEMIQFDPVLEKALHGPDASTFPMQKTWARAPKGCFSNSGSRAFLQAFADRRVANITAEFSNGYSLSDLARECAVMGDFALLLILESIRVDVTLIEGWKASWHKERSDHASEAGFYTDYYACVGSGFEYALARFSA